MKLRSFCTESTKWKATYRMGEKKLQTICLLRGLIFKLYKELTHTKKTTNNLIKKWQRTQTDLFPKTYKWRTGTVSPLYPQGLHLTSNSIWSWLNWGWGTYTYRGLAVPHHFHIKDLSILGFWYPWASWTIPQEYQETTIPLKLLHIINHQRNANQNHKEISPDIC